MDETISNNFLPNNVQVDTNPLVNDVTDFLSGGYSGYHKEQDQHSPSFSRAGVEDNIQKS